MDISFVCIQCLTTKIYKIDFLFIFKLHNVHQSQYQQTTNSMRNINEIVNSSKPFQANNINQQLIKDDQNYTNLQQALRAATVALQKSKATTNILTSQSISKSNANLTQNYSDTKQHHRHLQQQQQLQQAVLPSDSNTSSSFQPYSKHQQQHQQLNTGVEDSSNKVYRNSLNLLIEKSGDSSGSSGPVNNENAQPDQQQPKQQTKVARANRSASSPVACHATDKYHSASDYDNLEDNIDISVNLNCLTTSNSNPSSRFVSLKPADEISLLDETKTGTHKSASQKSSPSTEHETVSSFSSPSSISSTKSSSSRSAHSSGAAKHSTNGHSISSAKKSAFSSTMNLNDQQLANDPFSNGSQHDIYREVGIDVIDTTDNARAAGVKMSSVPFKKIFGIFNKFILRI